MAEEQIRSPVSFGGLVRYFEEYKSKIQLKPAHIILLIIAFIIAVKLLAVIRPL